MPEGTPCVDVHVSSNSPGCECPAYSEVGDSVWVQVEGDRNRIAESPLLAVVNGRVLGHEVGELYPDGGDAFRINLKEKGRLARSIHVTGQAGARGWAVSRAMSSSV
jgi:hypothetical protein